MFLKEIHYFEDTIQPTIVTKATVPNYVLCVRLRAEIPNLAYTTNIMEIPIGLDGKRGVEMNNNSDKNGWIHWILFWPDTMIST